MRYGKVSMIFSLCIFKKVFTFNTTFSLWKPLRRKNMEKSKKFYSEQICSVLKDRRIKLGYSQYYVRNSYGIDPSKIEIGKVEPGISKFIGLCKALGISPGWVLILYRMKINELISNKRFSEIISDWESHKADFECTELYLMKRLSEEKTGRYVSQDYL